jgi:nucleotidyltransferase substrate binding protein (TIGR01987 family)
MELSLANLNKALNALDLAIAQPKSDFIRDSVIQRFEFSYELAWKALRKQLIVELGDLEIDGISRRDLFRKALGQKLISSFETWTGFHEARNSTSHNYNEANAEIVYKIALQFAAEARSLEQTLAARGWTHAP